MPELGPHRVDCERGQHPLPFSWPVIILDKSKGCYYRGRGLQDAAVAKGLDPRSCAQAAMGYIQGFFNGRPTTRHFPGSS